MTPERSEWRGVAELMAERTGDRRARFGPQVAGEFERDPSKLLHRMSHYKFAAKMIGPGKRVLDVGCGEGLGTYLLAVECGLARGVDADEQALAVARANWDFDERVEFAGEGPPDERYDAVVSLSGQSADASGIARVLASDGVAVVGAPDAALEERLHERFGHVFMFSAADEVVHAGVLPTAPYLLALACKPRSSSTETAS